MPIDSYPPSADESSPRPSLPPGPSQPSERRALGLCTLAAAIALIWIAAPLGIGILLGMLGAFWVQPLYRRLRRHMPHTPDLAALTCVTSATLVLAFVIGLVGYELVVHGVAMAQGLIAMLSPAGVAGGWEDSLARRLAPLHVQIGDLVARLREAATDLAARAAELAAAIASATANVLLTLFFLTLTMHFTLRNWDRIGRRAEVLLPLSPRHTRALLSEFQRVGRSVLAGTVFTGMAQGALAWIGYEVFGVPQAAFFGAMTAFASLIPAVGTLLVWVPIGIWLLVMGHAGAAVGVMVYSSLVVVGVSDYLIRPRLVGGQGEVPPLLTFIALFGGVEAFGLMGLVIGPVIMSLGLALLRIYEKEVAPGAHIAPIGSPSLRPPRVP
jgi:predicted PurR-regulated permease PerM